MEVKRWHLAIIMTGFMWIENPPLNKALTYHKNNDIVYHFRNHTMPLLLFSSIHQTKHIPVYDNIIYGVRLVQF